MLANYIDVTASIVANKKVVISLSNWDYAVVQVIAPTGTMSISATNDSGDIQGVTDGSYKTATNFSTVQATKLSDGTSVNSLASTGLYRVGVVGRFLQIGDGTTAGVTKCVIMLTKIS